MAIDKSGKIQRPLLGPSFLEDVDPGLEQELQSPSKLRALRVVWRLMWRAFKTLWKLLTYDPLRRKLRIEESGTISTALWGLAYRMMFVPIVLAGLVCLLVYYATHPRTHVLETDMGTTGVYYDNISFMTQDNVRIEGVFYPMLDARQVLLEKENALRKRYPAVVLVHDLGMRKDQMLPLVRPLHDAGFVVLALNLRGNGTSGAGAAQTFGLREAMDVRAAVEELRRRPSVDAMRITIVAAGTGATAAMLHARNDPAIAALVVTNPIMDVETLLDGKLAPRHKLLAWLRPLCKWTFEMAYMLDIDDVAWHEFEQLRQTRPVLVLGGEGGQIDYTRPRHIDEIRSFLIRQVVEPKLPVVKAND